MGRDAKRHTAFFAVRLISLFIAAVTIVGRPWQIAGTVP